MVSAPREHGLTFGKPVAFPTGPLTTVGLPVTNGSSLVKSASLKLTYQSGATGATAQGSVHDVRPGQTKLAILIAIEAVPETYGAVRVEVESILREVAPGTEPSAKLTVGQPSLRTEGGVPRVFVDVRNSDTTAHSFSLSGGFYDGADLVGLARGGIDELGPGKSRTAALIVAGIASGAPAGSARDAANRVPAGYERIDVAVDAVAG
jgi:hypothetical protein